MMRMHSKRMMAQQRAPRVARAQVAYAYERFVEYPCEYPVSTCAQAAYAYERFARDGLLFYLKEAHYALGSSPLCLAWKARSIPFDMGSLASGAASHAAWHPSPCCATRPSRIDRSLVRRSLRHGPAERFATAGWTHCKVRD